MYYVDLPQKPRLPPSTLLEKSYPNVSHHSWVEESTKGSTLKGRSSNALKPMYISQKLIDEFFTLSLPNTQKPPDGIETCGNAYICTYIYIQYRLK